MSPPPLPLEELRSINPAINEGVYSVLSVNNSVKSRTSYGGTAPSEVRKQIRYWRRRLAKENKAAQKNG